MVATGCVLRLNSVPTSSDKIHLLARRFFVNERKISVRLARNRSDKSLPLLPVFALKSRRIRQQYDQAVEGKDLGKALQMLESLEAVDSTDAPSNLSFLEDEGLGQLASVRNYDELFPRQDPRKVLDACLNAMDLKLVGRTYSMLQQRGLIPSFGRYKSVTADGPRDVTPSVLSEAVGLEVSKLCPKTWGLSGTSVAVLLGAIALFSFLVDNGINIRPLMVSVLVLVVGDSVYLGGIGLAQVLSFWSPYRRRVLVHEAGHVLVAYLLGCPVRGAILDALQAMKLGIQGQAGTQFWDETLEQELRQGLLTNASIDRYSMVLFAGIAAEALVFGEAEGGENDENLFKSIVSFLRPPWPASQISNQARWAVLQSFKILKEHKTVLEAIVTSLEKGATLGTLVKNIEVVMLSSSDPVKTAI